VYCVGIAVFQSLVPRSLIASHERFGGACCLQKLVMFIVTVMETPNGVYVEY